MKRFLIPLLLCFAMNAEANEPKSWVTYYGSALAPEDFAPFDVIVFDGESHPDIAPLKAQGKTVIGYLSLGEAENYRSHYKEMAKQGLLLAPNPQWKGHRIVDIRKPEWAGMVIEQLIPPLIEAGFDGVMLDTIDSPLHLENTNPTRYVGMRVCAIRLLKVIRHRYPDFKIMLNRGYEILPDAAEFIDISLAESTRADMGNDKKPVLIPQQEYLDYVKIIQQAKLNNPKLAVYTLDYWNMKDTKGVARIYTEQRANGFLPYVSTPDLQKIYPEPQ